MIKKSILNKSKSTKGITLVALVITIIVLLILAAVTFNTLLGNEGLLKRATDSVNAYKKAQQDEEDILKNYENEIDKNISKEKNTATVTGQVSPIAFNDRGYGEDFLKKFDVTVELRTETEIEATGNLKVAARKIAENNIGEFTFYDVPFGNYILYISKPGYLTRYMKITISKVDEEAVILTAPSESSFKLWFGDLDGNRMIDMNDLTMIFSNYADNIEDSRYDAKYDANADGIVDALDLAAAQLNINKTVLDYAGAQGIF